MKTRDAFSSDGYLELEDSLPVLLLRLWRDLLNCIRKERKRERERKDGKRERKRKGQGTDKGRVEARLVASSVVTIWGRLTKLHRDREGQG